MSVSTYSELEQWLHRLKRDSTIIDISTIPLRDVLYLYRNYSTVPQVTDLLLSDSIQLNNNNSIVGLVLDDRDTITDIHLLKNLDTVIVHNSDMLQSVRERVPNNVRVILDVNYEYLNRANNDSTITGI